MYLQRENKTYRSNVIIACNQELSTKKGSMKGYYFSLLERYTKKMDQTVLGN
jgi:hypothetical protein